MLQVRKRHSYLNRSCTERISVKRSIGIHPTKKCAHWTTATHLHCLKDQIKAAPCAAYLSSQFLETAQLHSYKNWITCHLHICVRTRGWGLVRQKKNKKQKKKKPDRTRSTWAASFQRKRWFLCCQRCTAFFLWVVLKDQTGRNRPYPLQYRTTYPYLSASNNQPIISLSLPKLSISSSKMFSHRTKISFPTILNGFNLSAFNFPFEKCRSHPCSTYRQALFTPEKSTKKLPHNPKRTNAYQLYSITQSYAFIMQ